MCHIKREHWIRATLSNDEESTDKQVIRYFVQNGLTYSEATIRVRERDQYLNQNIICDNA